MTSGIVRCRVGRLRRRSPGSRVRALCGFCVFIFAIAAAGSASAQISQGWPVEDPPRPLAAHPVAFPPYQMDTLPNGLRVVVVLQHEQPAVSMRLLIRAGSAEDPKDKLGTARLSASLLTEGTATKSAEQLADFIDFIGGQMSSGAGTDLSFVNMVVMKDSFEAGLATVAEMARRPAYAPAEIERQRQQILSGLQVSLQDPGYVADAVFDRLVYGFHPYGLPQSGTPETIAAITRDDLVAFHDHYFAPNNAILAIVGDLTADEALSAVTRSFGDWPRREIRADRFINPPDAARRIVIVNKPDAVQTEVRVGHIGVPRRNPDYMALNLAIRILGGEGSNRLHQVLRTARGLTYGAEADFDTLKESGDIEAQTNTRSDATPEVVRLMVDEFWRLQRERVGDHELEGAKAYLSGSFPLTIETPDQIALQILNHVFYDLPMEELQNFRERVNAVTADDIQRVAKQYLRPDRLVVVLVGNAAAFAPQLDAAGFPHFEVVDLSDLDLTAENLKHDAARAGQAGQPGRVGQVAARTAYAQASQQAPQTPPAITPQGGARAKALLDRVIAAKGGLDALRGLKTERVVATTSVTTPSGTRQSESTTFLEYPSRFRVEGKMGATEAVQVFDGQHAWMKTSRGVQEAPAPIAREFEATIRRDVVSLLLGAVDGTIKARALPDVKDPEGRVSHALEMSAADLEPTVLYVDPQSGLITKQTYVVNAPGQPLVEEAFSDYRPVDGIQIAWTATRIVDNAGGRATLTRRITDIKINVPLDPALFTKPTP